MEIENGDPVWLELNTPDVDAAMDFYHRVFGWRFQQRSTGNFVGYAANELPVASFTQIEDADVDWRVYFQVPDVPETTAAVAVSRGRILRSPARVEGLGHLAVIEDPTGAVFALSEASEISGFVLGTGHGQPAWFEVVSNCFQISLSFYHDVLGWNYHFVDDDGIMTLEQSEDDYFATNGPTASASAGVVDGMRELIDDELPHWRSYFAVNDIDEAVAAVSEAGGTTRGEVTRGILGRQVSVTDPQGGRFVLLEADTEE